MSKCAIIINNAVICWNRPWQYGCNRPDALPSGRAFLIYQYGGIFMSVSYKKLWKLLIDKDMKKKDLCEKAGISPASVTKMGRNGHVTTEILVKICAALDCRIEDIVEIVPD
jgi:putative transcriptional regulator